MTFIDAYIIVEDYIDSCANGQRQNESWVRVSALKNSKKEICEAFKLFYAHALFWSTFPNDKLEQYELILAHIGDFCDDKIVDEFYQIEKILNNRNPFTKLRDKSKREKFEERKKQIALSRTQSMLEGFKCKGELVDFISWFSIFSKDFKNKCSALPDKELSEKYPNLIGNFVCDIYEAAHIERDINDTEYFWPIATLYQFTNDSKFDYLFGKYKAYISHMYTTLCHS